MSFPFALLILSLIYAVLLHSERLQDMTKRPPIWIGAIGILVAVFILVANIYDEQNFKLYTAPALIIVTFSVTRTFRQAKRY